MSSASSWGRSLHDGTPVLALQLGWHRLAPPMYLGCPRATAEGAAIGSGRKQIALAVGNWEEDECSDGLPALLAAVVGPE
jgi:hypothetical protein